MQDFKLWMIFICIVATVTIGYIVFLLHSIKIIFCLTVTTISFLLYSCKNYFFVKLLITIVFTQLIDSLYKANVNFIWSLLYVDS